MRRAKAVIFAFSLLLGLALFPFCTFSQEKDSSSFSQQNIPLNQTYFLELEYAINDKPGIGHYGFLPLLNSRTKVPVPQIQIGTRENTSWFVRKSLHEHLVQYDSDGIQLIIDPLVNQEMGRNYPKDIDSLAYYQNVRGFQLKLNLGSKVSVSSSFRENQILLPSYYKKRISSSSVAYGQGRVKKFGKNGFDFAMASSTLSYSPYSFLNIQVGTNKHFIGYGNRSLILSDMAFNYPYIKVNTEFFKGKLQYQNLFALFQDLNRIETDFQSEGLFERKQGSFHYLDFAVNEQFNIALFEGMIYPSLDSSGVVGVPATYWMPVIFLNSLLHNDAKEGNNMAGLNFIYKIQSNVHLYGQSTFPGFETKSFSWQGGAKYYLKAFPIRFQAEYNSIGNANRPNLFTHYNESLNSPAGPGSEEWMASITVKKNRWLTSLAYNTIRRKVGNIENVNFSEIRQSFILNPTYNLAINLGAQIRNQSNLKNEQYYFYLGLSTNLQNIYFNY